MIIVNYGLQVCVMAAIELNNIQYRGEIRILQQFNNKFSGNRGK